MKQFLLCLISFLIALSSSAQINTTTVDVAAPKQNKKPQAPYDSTDNFPTNNAKYSYIGQEVYFQAPYDRSIGYVGCLRPRGGTYDINELEGHYFIVDDITDNTGAMSEFEPYVVVLHDKDNPGRTLRKAMDFDHERTFRFHAPWITVSYYNYLKNLIGSKYYCLQKELVRKGYYGYEEKFCLNDHDIYTGEEIEINRTDLWELIELTTHSQTKRLIAIFKNSKGQTTFSDIMDIGITPRGSYYLLPKKEYDRLTKKYGSYYTKMILNDQYAVGMPKELFLLLKGNPYEINSSSYNQQWIYGSSSSGYDYYYFKNGKLTGWN